MTMRTLILAGCACAGVVTGVLVHRIHHGRSAVGSATRAALDGIDRDESAPAQTYTVHHPVINTRADPPLGPVGDVIGNVDPASNDYDPVTLGRVMRIRPSELLSKEPRVLAFAEQRELALRVRVAARLRMRVSFETKVDVECRTSSCDIRIQGPTSVDDMNVALDAIDIGSLSEMTEIGTATGEGGGEQRVMKIVMLYSAERRNHATYDLVLKQHEAHDEQRKEP